MMEEERKRQLERMAEQQRPALQGEPTTLHPPVDCLVILCFCLFLYGENVPFMYT